MRILIGIGIILVATIGIFSMIASNIEVFLAAVPKEGAIILGTGIGAYVIANRAEVLRHTLQALPRVLAPPRYSKDSYLELLSLLYTSFKLAKTKGMLALEQHVENPGESALFQRFPRFMNDQSSLVFLCDYLRLLTLGTDNPHEVEALLDEEIETHRHELQQVPGALQVLADAMPALGIVAAVLGVIKTMGVIDQPANIIGASIGGALVGTFLGVLLGYGFIGPMATLLKNDAEAELRYLYCMKAGILAHMQGYAPAVSVEFARKTLAADVRPTFYEVETTVSSLPAV
ncbi:MAG: flagellar motor stator protein MotA [Alphaproteobacteria bacterium]|nr:flagellar motor stator protein MotA [Alphaproteobacteria bacterium]TAD90354.1 MAG: flagellar motor stator protein MotA [Alphaproteobacteria bacterium]